MVGRDRELGALGEFVAGLREGEPGVALVHGRAGMGKTRLVTEAAHGWRGAARVLVGGCAPDGPPYTPVLAALRPALPPSAPVVRMLVGGQATSRSELFDALGASLAGLAGRSPLVLVIEDLHWSDRATRDALAYLVTQADVGRWGLVATLRYEGPLTQTELAAFTDVLQRRQVLRVALEPLTVGQVADQVAGITGTAPSADVATGIHRRSGGIPLLVEEVVAAGGQGVPDHLRGLFLARLREHGPEVAKSLQALAVAETCDELVMADVLDWDVASVASAVRRCVDADLVTADVDGYRFRHDLLREAVYDDVPPGRRRRLHGLVAAVLARRADTDPAVLATHWQRAGAPDQAAPAHLDAAERAERLHAPAAAHEHFERVIEAWPRLSESARAAFGPRDELLRRAALAAERSGAFARAASLTEERLAIPAGAPADRALRWERLGRYRWESGDGPGSRAAYEEAVRVLPPDAPAAVRAQVVSGLAWHLAATFEFDEARRVSDQALAACGGVEDAAVRWQAYLACGIAGLGTEEGHRALEESCRLATALGAGDQIALTRMWLNLSLQRLGLTGAREVNLRAALRAASADGLGRSMEAALRYMLAELLLETGRWDEADEAIGHNLRLRVAGIPAYFTWGYRARLAAWRGDGDGLAEAVERTRALAELAPQQPLPLATALTGQAEALLWAGEVERAVPVAREAVRLAAVDPLCRAESLTVLCRAEADRAERAARHGRPDGSGADPQLGALVAETDLAGHPRRHALACTSRAERGREAGERIAAPWRAATEAWAQAGDAYQEAGARWRLAWALVADRSGRSEAAAHLARAHDVAQRLGAEPLRAAVQQLARRARLPLRDTPNSGAADTLAASLTGRELEVLPLLAAGRTNAEIANVLFISPRTVGVHVSHILHKLGAARRIEAADLARRAGLLPD
jgi:ATP/maltotriose-dependent transcriptional regulator MalT